jgi:hypothetical protein
VESKLLNFPDAMRLAQIVSKHIDTESLVGMNHNEVTVELFSKLSEDEITALIQLLGIEVSGDFEPEQVSNFILKSLMDNNLVGILETYRSIGFQK